VAFDTNDPVYQELIGYVQNTSKVVPFIGAGLSVYGDARHRLPPWRELLTRLVAECQLLGVVPDDGDHTIQSALDNNQYIQATNLILAKLGEPNFRRAVERELDDTDKPVPPAVIELVSISWSLIVTTNLDRMIARAYHERYGRDIDQITNLEVSKLRQAFGDSLPSSRTALAQLHGALDTYDSWRLTSAHYAALLQDSRYLDALRQLFARRLFFVGFGLEDEDFEYMRKHVAEIYPDRSCEFYALIERARRNDPMIHALVRTGLRPIYYDADPEPDPDDPFGGHRAVFECLQSLAAAGASRAAGFTPTLMHFPQYDPSLSIRRDEIDSVTALLLASEGCVVQIVGIGGSGKTSLAQQLLHCSGTELTSVGYNFVFGSSFQRADLGEFIRDLAIATVGRAAPTLPAQVDEICSYLRAHRAILILDGLEVLVDEAWRLPDSLLMRLAEAVLEGRGSVVATTRSPVRGGLFEHANTVDISALSSSQVASVLTDANLGFIDAKSVRRIEEITAGHPLALRILMGVLFEVPRHMIAATLDATAVVNIADEADPQGENRLARILASYLHHLDEAEISFLTCATVFDGPVPFRLMQQTLARRYPDTSINHILVDRDLRSIVLKLMERRLVTESIGGGLASHPSVKEYFTRHAKCSRHSIVPLHRMLASDYVKDTQQTPMSFDEAAPLLTAARHAAASQEWTLFDEIFRRRLMRVENHLCNNLGAWEEALALARLGYESSFPSALTTEPAYYPATVARCLKHLGRSAESRSAYQDALLAAARSHDPNTAKYVNNCLTLLITRGELVRADKLVELNMRALDWVDEQWKYCWQLDQGLASIAYLRMLQGDAAESLRLLNRAEHAWDDNPSGPMMMFSHYPYHRSELILLADPRGHDMALEAIGRLLSIANSESWPESVCRGHVQAAQVYLDRCERTWSRVDLVHADQHLRKAQEIAAGMVVPDVEIKHLLTRVKRYLVHWSRDMPVTAGHVELSDLVARVAARVEMSALALAGAEVDAARGALAYLRGLPDEACGHYMQAIEQCRAQGYKHAVVSPRSLVYWLGSRLGHERVEAPTWQTDPTAFLGARLTAKQMVDQVTLALTGPLSR
jgi:tetratricopeptide (TPR) repeat protein